MNLTTARSRLIPSLEKQEMPACLPLVSLTGGERAVMKFKEECETDVFINENAGVTVLQEQEECMHCGHSGGSMVSFFGTNRIRDVANEMLRLADELDKSR